ncbi:MAG TPA: type II toxin-antitoxin system VapB family antitoxin [Galbitalea sp.]
MTVTSVDIDSEILRQAKDIYGVKTNREAIDLALRDVVIRRHQLDAIDAISSMTLDTDATKIAYGG